MKNKIIDALYFIPATIVHIGFVAEEWRQKRLDKKRQDEFFKRNPQARRYNETL